MNAHKTAAISGESLFKRVIQSPRFFTYSILVHVVFVAVLLLSFDWHSKPKPMPHVIQAVVIDESQISAEVEKLRLADEKKKKASEAQQQKLDKAKKESQREEQRLAELKKKREAEKRKLKTEEKKRRDVEKQRKAEEKKQRDVEKQRVAKEKRLKQQKQDQLKKLKIEEARLEKQMQREEEVRIKQAEKRKQQQELERVRQEEARIRQQQLAEEQRQLDVAREREFRSIVDKHVEIIRQKVNRNWLRPSGSMTGLVCTVKVRIIPGGEVLDVRITKSSGNAVFDRSVETAVFKASPLPLPADRALFDRFRELEFIFDPEG